MSEARATLTGMWSPEYEAHRLGLRITYEVIPDHGRFYPHLRLIVIHPDLDPITRRCITAHEVAHGYYMDMCGDPRTEARAWRWAAQRLVDLDTLVQAARDYPQNPEQWCHALSVTPKVLETWLAQPSNYRAAHDAYRRAA